MCIYACIGVYEEALLDIAVVLIQDPKHTKARARRARIYEAQVYILYYGLTNITNSYTISQLIVYIIMITVHLHTIIQLLYTSALFYYTLLIYCLIHYLCCIYYTMHIQGHLNRSLDEFVLAMLAEQMKQG